MSEFEERLINSVKQNPCLYNKSNTGFRNRLRRNRAWASVSNECGLPVKRTQCKWKTLRDRFVREYHKCNDAQMETSNWRYFNQLSFLLDHIKPRLCCTLDNNQLDLDDSDASTKSLCYGNDDSNRSSSSPHPSKMDAKTKNNNRVELTLSDESSNGQPQLSIEQAQSDFRKVMGLLAKLLEEKSVETQQDAFYKYLDGMLSQVDEQTRSDIQLELLNNAHKLVKDAKANISNS